MVQVSSDSIRRRLGKAFDEADHPRDARGRWTSGSHAADNHANFPARDARRADAIDRRLDTHFAGLHAARRQIADHVQELKAAHKALSAHHAGAQRALSDLNDLYEKHDYEPIAEEEVAEIDEAGSLRASLAQLFEDTAVYVPARDRSATGGTHEDPLAALDAALQASLSSAS